MEFLLSSLKSLPASYVSLDASRPWIAYWCLHALDLLGVRPTAIYPSIVEWLGRCRSPEGGFGGGPGQAPHAATTYAAVLALCVIGTPEAYAAIDRDVLYHRYFSWRTPGGGFRVQDGGEVDVRGSFTVLAISELLGITTPELVRNATSFLASCQTYEGGFGGEPGSEAHGGYTFCALGALHVLRQMRIAHVDVLARWLAGRQMLLEGGFQGRTNKLVDSCYSFWQGACFDILAEHVKDERSAGVECCSAPPFDRDALQRYILCCAQQDIGGLRDKPGKRRDQYHSCYALSGLSIAQHGVSVTSSTGLDSDIDTATASGSMKEVTSSSNKIAATHPVFNIRRELVEAAMNHFGRMSVPAAKFSDTHT